MKLTATAVKHAKGPKLHNDGRGLYLKVTKRGTRSWIFRWRDRTTGRLRDMGLGSSDDFTLAEARQAAHEARKLVHAGGDPIVARDKERAQRRANAAKMLTFNQAAQKFIAARVEPTSKNPKHVAQWRSTLTTYASPVMGSLAVNMIDDGHVLSILEPIWYEKTETASRVQQRIAKVLDWAKAQKLRTGDNPARWKGHLDALLPRPSDVKNVKHQPALPYGRLYEFMQDIRQREGASARCLEFLILTATRTREATGAKWSEIDFDARTWTIPSERLKVKVDSQTKKPKIHRVPLSAAALAVLEAQKGQHKTYVFAGSKGGHISDMAMLEFIKDLETEYTDGDGRRIVPHGFRSSFRTWAAETTSFPHDICEAALAHSIKNKVESAYQHSDLLAKRAKLMDQWATFANTKPGGKVTQIKATA